MSHETCCAPGAKEQHLMMGLGGHLACCGNGGAELTQQLLSSGGVNIWMKRTVGRKKMNPHDTGLWNPVGQAGHSAPLIGGQEGQPGPAVSACGRSWEEPSPQAWPVFREILTGSRRTHRQASPAAVCKQAFQRGNELGKEKWDWWEYSSMTTFLRTGEAAASIFVDHFSWLAMIAGLKITEVCTATKASRDVLTHPSWHTAPWLP